MRVMLACTVLEALKKVTRAWPRTVSPELADALRSDTELFAILMDEEHRHSKGSVKEQQDKKLRRLWAGETDDLTVVVRRLRNMFAHGYFTSNRLGAAKSPRRRRLLDDLVDAALRSADEDFSAWVETEQRTVELESGRP